MSSDNAFKPMRGAGATFEVNGRRVGRASWGPQDVDNFSLWIDGQPYVYQRPVSINVESAGKARRVTIGDPPVCIETNTEGEGALTGLVAQFNAYPDYIEESSTATMEKTTSPTPKEPSHKQIRSQPENGDLFD